MKSFSPLQSRLPQGDAQSAPLAPSPLELVLCNLGPPMRRVHLSPELVMSVDVAALRALFDAIGDKSVVRAVFPRARGKTEAIARALFGVTMEDEAADALTELVRTATDAGCRALDEALADPALGLGLAKALPFAARADEAHVDRVARLLAMRARDPDPKKRALLARVFVRVRLRLDRWLPPRASYEVVLGAKEDRDHEAERDSDFAARVARELREALGDAFVDVYVDDYDGAVHVAVLHRAPVVAHASRGDGGGVSRVLTRAVLADDLRFDRATGRLFLVTARPSWLAAYVRAMRGALLLSRARSAGDASAPARDPSSSPSLSFKWIQARGAAALREIAIPRGVLAVDIVGCQWSAGKGVRKETRGPGALAALEEGAPLAGGYITRLTLRLRVAESPYPVDVFMQLPHRLSFSDMRYEAHAREVMRALHVFEPGALADDAHTLAPFEHPEWRWLEIVGREAFARMAHMARAKLLVRVKTRRVASAEHRRLGHTFVVQDIPGEDDAKYAMAEDESEPARTVSDDATAMWQLDAIALARAMRADLGTPPSETSATASAPAHASDGLLDLGVLALASGKIHFFYALCPAGKRALAGAVGACPLGVTPVVLVPAGRRFAEATLRQVDLSILEQLGAASVAWVTGHVAEALGAADEVEAWRRVGTGIDVVIEKSTQRVWLLGALLVHLSDNVYKLFECLAVNSGRVVPVKDLGVYMSRNSSAPDALVRRTRAEIDARVTRSLREAGVKVTADVREKIGKLAAKKGRGGYTMELAVKVMG
jgi:hypothetical protein